MKKLDPAGEGGMCIRDIERLNVQKVMRLRGSDGPNWRCLFQAAARAILCMA
jgi:hypothetical protein